MHLKLDVVASICNPSAPVIKWKAQTDFPIVPRPASWGTHPQTVRDLVSNKMESEGGHSGLSTDLQTCILALAHMNRHTLSTHTRGGGKQWELKIYMVVYIV